MRPATYTEERTRLKSLAKMLGREFPGPMAAFAELHKQASGDGALSVKTKELIALGIGIAARCDGCVAHHVHDALRAGATRAEVLEAIGVAILMGGGPAAMFGLHAFEALGEFEATARTAPAPSGKA